MPIAISGLKPGQVLQRLQGRGADATLSGICSETGTVWARITSRGRSLRSWTRRDVGAAKHGRFTVKLRNIPVGGPFEVALTIGEESVCIGGIRVGDVWLLAGQSNMEGRGRIEGAPHPHPRVRARFMVGHWGISREPIPFPQESSDSVHCAQPLALAAIRRLRRQARTGVGPGVFFGREMVRRSGGIPQGLIGVAHGGTAMSQWDPSLKRLGGRSLYGSMLRALRETGQPISGVLWYQGESDANPTCVPHYTRRMRRLVAALRHDLRQPRLPFLMVQIGKVFGTGWAAGWDVASWNQIQEQQRLLENDIPRLACVASVDLAMDDAIHVGSAGFSRLGARLARLADGLVYGHRKEPPAPSLKSIRRIHRKDATHFAWEVRFRNIVGGLRARGLPCGFALLDEKGHDTQLVFQTRLAGDRAIVEADINQDYGFRLKYGHGAAPQANLTDGRDMPIPVLGPLADDSDLAPSPFITRWLVSRILPAERSLRQIPPPRSKSSMKLAFREFTTHFVDMHLDWEGRDGRVFFFTTIHCQENLRVELRVGSDGPIRVWVDGRPVLADLRATNPALIDKKIQPVLLRRGTHRVAVAMDLNHGLAWGFFMRFNRCGIPRAKLAARDYAVPMCTLTHRERVRDKLVG